MHQTTVTTLPGTTGAWSRARDQEPVSLRILGWDHPRCMAPMRAAAERYRKLHPHVELALQSRPLASFNDEPLEALGRDVDLVVFDHPMVPQAAAAESLLALDLVAHELQAPLVVPETIGASGDSYVWDGHRWGLAVDAACQVAAGRVDVLEQLGVNVPVTWDDVLALASEHPGSVALPLYASDAFCALLSISAALAPDGLKDAWLAPGAVELLSELTRCVDATCFQLNPPALLDILRSGGHWAYVPLTFGYAGSTAPGLAWFDAPRVDGRPPGAVLGGAGLGLTGACSSPAEALRFALWYAQPETQAGIVLTAGGQPAARAVWDDAACDALAHGLFSGTRQTIDHAIVRPPAIWWPLFQAAASQRLHQLLLRQASAEQISTEMNALHDHYANR